MQPLQLLLSVLLGLPLGAIANVPSVPAETSTAPATSFYAQNGTGLFGLAGRPNIGITFVSVAIEPAEQAADQVDISVRLSDGRLMSFGGLLKEGDAYTLAIDLTHSGMADASGVVNVRYGANQSILNLTANGQLDGQTFFMTFRGTPQQ